MHADKYIDGLIGVLIVVLVAAALIPEVFTALVAVEADTDVPSWVGGTLITVAGAGFVYLMWRVFMK